MSYHLSLELEVDGDLTLEKCFGSYAKQDRAWFVVGFGKSMGCVGKERVMLGKVRCA